MCLLALISQREIKASCLSMTDGFEAGLIGAKGIALLDFGVVPHGLPALAHTGTLIAASVELGAFLLFEFRKLLRTNAVFLHHSWH